MLPDPDRGAASLAGEFLERFPDAFGVMQPHGDSYMAARHYCGSPWLGRGWIERAYGGRGPMWPGYRHNWADNELFWVSRCLGALWSRPDVAQRHEHFTRSGGAEPDYWTEQVARPDRDDVQLFIARAWQGFPGHEPLGEAPAFDHDLFRREYRSIAESYWITRYGLGAAAPEAARRMRAALQRLARAGKRRVALYGAGTHTRAMGGALMQPPVEIVCLIDDDPRLAGERLWNYPIVGRDAARTLGLDAVVLSSNSREEELREAAAALASDGVEIVPLYALKEVGAPRAPASDSAAS